MWWGSTLLTVVGAVFAGGKARDRMSKTEGGNTLELRVVEVEGDVFGGRTVNGAVTRAARGEEAGLLFRSHVEPEGFGLQVV
jgi:hypothetical protein